MMIQPSEARELCSKPEWELVESSFSPMVEAFPRSALKSRLDRARKLYGKTTDLVSLQHSESRKRTTHRKTEMFARPLIKDHTIGEECHQPDIITKRHPLDWINF